MRWFWNVFFFVFETEFLFLSISGLSQPNFYCVSISFVRETMRGPSDKRKKQRRKRRKRRAQQLSTTFPDRWNQRRKDLSEAASFAHGGRLAPVDGDRLLLAGLAGPEEAAAAAAGGVAFGTAAGGALLLVAASGTAAFGRQHVAAGRRFGAQRRRRRRRQRRRTVRLTVVRVQRVGQAAAVETVLLRAALSATTTTATTTTTTTTSAPATTSVSTGFSSFSKAVFLQLNCNIEAVHFASMFQPRNLTIKGTLQEIS